MSEKALTVTAEAQAQIRTMMEGREGPLAVRINMLGEPPASNYQAQFGFVADSETTKDDQVLACEGFRVFMNPASAKKLAGATIGFDESHMGGFHIQYPPEAFIPPEMAARRREWKDPVAIAVQEVIDNQVNPALGDHGGYVVLVDVQGDKAFVELSGGCQGCAMAAMTLKDGIEVMIN